MIDSVCAAAGAAASGRARRARLRMVSRIREGREDAGTTPACPDVAGGRETFRQKFSGVDHRHNSDQGSRFATAAIVRCLPLNRRPPARRAAACQDLIERRLLPGRPTAGAADRPVDRLADPLRARRLAVGRPEADHLRPLAAEGQDQREVGEGGPDHLGRVFSSESNSGDSSRRRWSRARWIKAHSAFSDTSNISQTAAEGSPSISRRQNACRCLGGSPVDGLGKSGPKLGALRDRRRVRRPPADGGGPQAVGAEAGRGPGQLPLRRRGRLVALAGLAAAQGVDHPAAQDGEGERPRVRRPRAAPRRRRPSPPGPRPRPPPSPPAAAGANETSSPPHSRHRSAASGSSGTPPGT